MAAMRPIATLRSRIRYWLRLVRAKDWEQLELELRLYLQDITEEK